MAPADRGENAAPVPKKDLSLHSGALPDEMWLDEVLSRLEGET